MTIFTNSRYNGQNVLRVQASDGNTYPTVYRSAPALPRRYLHYTVKMNDRLDLLANTYYGDPTLWWVIADANPEVLYPFALTMGSILRIPQQ